MDTSTLLIVHRVMSERSIRGTARVMRKPVSSIAAAIDRLESQISVPLVQKAGTSVVLTLEAERLSPAIKQLAGHVQDIMAIGSRSRRDVSLSLSALARFAHVAETGSIRGAAKSLGLGQPQLARQIAHVEASLGCRLLNRRVDGSTMTEAGRRLLGSTRAIEAIWNELAHAAAGRSRRSAATIRLGFYGVEVCAMDQIAHIAHLDDTAWRCGVVAAGWLTQFTLGYEVKCFEEGLAGYAKIFGRCFLPDGEDIAKLALQQGMAMAIKRDGQPIEPRYGMIENEARLKRTGIWSSKFVHGGVLYRPGTTY